MPEVSRPPIASATCGKFSDPILTKDGTERAVVPLTNPTTLWFNTGTSCNVECLNCYIGSSPRNDRLVYITAAEVMRFLYQIKCRDWPVSETGLTGGEPFMNFEIIEIIRLCLVSGYEVLVLSNAMRPLMRPSVQSGMFGLVKEFGDWLSSNGFRLAVAGRTIWGESEQQVRDGYAELFRSRNYDIDPDDPAMTVLFPEIDETRVVPEISVNCRKILGKQPDDIMCASSRLVVKRKGESVPKVVSCTLLPYDREFEMGTTLEDTERPVRLNHPSCAQFCVLGGVSCSGK